MEKNNEFALQKMELNLFKEMQFFRLSMGVSEAKNKIEKNQTVNTDHLTGASKFFTSIGNSIKNSKQDTLYKNKEAAVSKLESFLRKNPSYRAKSAAETEIEHDVSLFFGNLTPMIEKERFAISVILDNEYEYPQNDSHDQAISRVLFGNTFQYGAIKKRLEGLYLEIAKKPLSAAQKGTMIGIGALSAAALFLFPVIMAGGITAAASTTTGALAAIGFGDMQLGIGMLSLYSALLGGAAMGLTYTAMGKANQEQLKQEFRNLSVNEAAELLAIRALLIERAKIYMDEADVKENISDLLALIDDFRSDTSYELLVERSNVAGNKDKIQLFHNFDKTMMKVCKV